MLLNRFNQIKAKVFGILTDITNNIFIRPCLRYLAF